MILDVSIPLRPFSACLPSAQIESEIVELLCNTRYFERIIIISFVNIIVISRIGRSSVKLTSF